MKGGCFNGAGLLQLVRKQGRMDVRIKKGNTLLLSGKRSVPRYNNYSAQSAAKGLGVCPPRKIFDYRPSEIISGAVLG